MGGKVIDGDPRIRGKSREIPGSGYAIRSEMIKSPDLGQESLAGHAESGGVVPPPKLGPQNWATLSAGTRTLV